MLLHSIENKRSTDVESPPTPRVCMDIFLEGKPCRLVRYRFECLFSPFCKAQYVITRKPDGAPTSERAIPVSIFQAEPAVARSFLREWTKDTVAGKAHVDSRPAACDTGLAILVFGPAVFDAVPAMSGVGPAVFDTGLAMSGFGLAVFDTGLAVSGFGPASFDMGPAMSDHGPARGVIT
jgi:hypothetical protein